MKPKTYRRSARKFMSGISKSARRKFLRRYRKRT